MYGSILWGSLAIAKQVRMKHLMYVMEPYLCFCRDVVCVYIDILKSFWFVLYCLAVFTRMLDGKFCRCPNEVLICAALMRCWMMSVCGCLEEVAYVKGQPFCPQKNAQWYSSVVENLKKCLMPVIRMCQYVWRWNITLLQGHLAVHTVTEELAGVSSRWTQLQTAGLLSGM